MTQSPDNPDTQQQWLLHGDLPCLGCQYNLRGLVGPVVKCPECGYANDLRNPAPWRKKKLPTGVRIREHWPATAALASFIVMLVLPGLAMAVGSALLGAPGSGGAVLSLLSLFALLPILVFAAAMTWWVLACLRWLRSCTNKRWAWSVLAGTHVAMWAFLFGLVGLMRWFNAPFDPLMALAIVVLPLATAAFFYLRAIIRRADRTGQFRSDWRKWQLPTGTNRDPSGR